MVLDLSWSSYKDCSIDFLVRQEHKNGKKTVESYDLLAPESRQFLWRATFFLLGPRIHFPSFAKTRLRLGQCARWWKFAQSSKGKLRYDTGKLLGFRHQLVFAAASCELSFRNVIMKHFWSHETCGNLIFVGGKTLTVTKNYQSLLTNEKKCCIVKPTYE